MKKLKELKKCNYLLGDDLEDGVCGAFNASKNRIGTQCGVKYNVEWYRGSGNPCPNCGKMTMWEYSKVPSLIEFSNKTGISPHILKNIDPLYAVKYFGSRITAEQYDGISDDLEYHWSTIEKQTDKEVIE